MLSRVADSLFWMSRYIERAENVARFIDVNLHVILDLPVGATEQWEPLVITTGDDAPFAERHGTATRENPEATGYDERTLFGLDLAIGWHTWNQLGCGYRGS